MNKRVLVFSAALAVALATAALGWAQEEKQPNLVRSIAVTVKPGMSGAFESAMREHMDLRRELGDPWEWTVYQVVDGDDLGTYYIRSGLVTWADFDAYYSRDWTKVEEHFSRVLDPLIESAKGTTEELEFGMSHWPEEPPDYKLFQVYIYYIKPAKMMDFYAGAGQFHGAIMQAGWDEYYIWYMIHTGSNGPVAALVVPAVNWADFEDPEKSLFEVITEVYGEQGANELVAKFYGSFYHYDSMIVYFRKDLSLVHER